ncbi:hypothetical protein D9M71_720340 [compost metagenome]
MLSEDVFQWFNAPSGDHDLVPVVQGRFGNGGTQASSCTGDKPDFIHCVAPVIARKSRTQCWCGWLGGFVQGQSRLAASQALRSKPSAEASAAVSLGARERILRAAMWSPMRLQDSTATSRSLRKHRTDSCLSWAEPRTTVLS